MLVNEWDERRTAKIYTHYILCRTLYEFVYANNGMLDMNVYPLMQATMKHKVCRLKRHYDYIYSFANNKESKAKFKRMHAERLVDLLETVENMHAYHTWEVGEDFPEAELLKCPSMYDLAEYVIPDKLLEYCLKGVKLTDSIMEEMIHEVHNKIYTLVFYRKLPFGKNWSPF